MYVHLVKIMLVEGRIVSTYLLFRAIMFTFGVCSSVVFDDKGGQK